MKTLTWLMVALLALFPWWAIPATVWLFSLSWGDAARAVTSTVAAFWTPSVLVAALLLAAKAEGRT
jgi:hypothetical protein